MAEFEFDVFLSHNSSDKPLVRELSQCLADAGLKVWLDEDQLIPGRDWQPLLIEGINCSATGAVLVSNDGLGPWANQEMQILLNQAVVESGKAVIPVLLPGAPQKPALPPFLLNRTWVDLRGGYTEKNIGHLIWGITGKKPDALSRKMDATQEAPTTPVELWPEPPTAQPNSNCYHQLQQLHARHELPTGEQRKTLWQAVKQNRPASLQQWQLANLARWSTPEYREVEELFTPLQVNVRVREDEDAPAEKQQLPFDTLTEAMAAVFEQQLAQAAVIFAPPGGGKSTLLRHYQLTQAQDLVEHGRLLFYAQLRDYHPATGVEKPALAWLESQWRKETHEAPPLAAFLQQGSLTLLLDGLNEIPRRSDEEYRARVAEWRELIDEIEHRHPGVRLLFACRPLDYSQRLDAGRHTRLPEIEIQAMEPGRIKAFIEKRFPSKIAAQLWGQLRDSPSLALYGSPYYLNLLLGQVDPKAERVTIPQNRADLFSGMVRERLRRECHRGNPRFKNPALLAEWEQTTILNDRSRGNRLPDETPFFAALAALAFHIQDDADSNERWGTRRRGKARRAMETALERELPADDYLEAACDLGLFEDDAAQAGDIRFIHQQIQEYFAAWVLMEQDDLDRLHLPWTGEELGADATEALLAQGGDDDLPELTNSGWEESALIAAGLSDHPGAFIRALMPANLALAGRCAAQAGAAIDERVRSELQQALIERSQHPQADLRARIEAARALGELGDPRLQAHRGESGGELLLPEFVTIEGGEVTIGGDTEGDPDEQFPKELTLAPFELARHPVTQAEFAHFVRAGGYREDAWWPGRALAWRNGEIGQEALQEQARGNRQTILDALGREASPEQIRDRFNLSLANARWWQERIAADNEAFDAWLTESYPPPDGPFTEPAYWRSPSWSNPAQPVVGICWYEARAYCLWLNTRLDVDHYRLPSEAEWEAAGRQGGEWRRYPWPGPFDPLKANTAETRLGVTTPVGVFPEGATPVTGLLDLAGNVWEWTTTPWFEGGEWQPALGSNDGPPDGRRVVRGGSWYYVRGRARLGYRVHCDPDLRLGDLGFRLCRASPI
ncbi:MAG: SUMF1/EgtB/PvdO family nonheme iron enzyme [Sedimenticola sp.]